MAEPANSPCVGYAFKPTKKLNHDILGFLNKSKTTGHCGFPLTNLHSGECVYYVPKSNPANYFDSFYVCSKNLQNSNSVIVIHHLET